MKDKILIKKIYARQIIDSNSSPTLEVDVMLTNNVSGRASVPSGTSTGEFEAVELRDNNKNLFNGKSVLTARENVNIKIAKKLKGFDIFDQAKIDNAMIALDGTKNKSALGANATVGVSLACARAAANAKNVPLYKYLGGKTAVTLPVPLFNILNGGKHADNNVNIQEFMIAPVGAESFSQALRMGVEIYQALKRVLIKNKYSTTVGAEGGFAPNLKSDEQALELIVEAIRLAGYSAGKQIKIALDVAASEMYNEAEKIKRAGNYYFWKTKRLFSSDELIDYYKKLCNDFPIFIIEDGLGETDWENWQKLTKTLGKKIILVGDDLFVTNKERLQLGIEKNVANAVLIKPNQIGTLTETLNTVSHAKVAAYKCVISHRSGETEDTFIADLAVAVNAQYLKTGAPCRGERVAKYNQLLRIEEQLGTKAKYPTSK